MPPNHLILCHPFLLLHSIFHTIRVFSNDSALHIRWPKYWSFSFNISPSNEHPVSLQSKGFSRLFYNTTVQKHQFFSAQLYSPTLTSIHDHWKNYSHSEGHQPCDFFGRNEAKAETPVLWPPHVKSWLIGKDSDAGMDWGQEEKETTEDEMAGWRHRLDGHEFGCTLGVGDGQGGLAFYSSLVAKSRTRLSNWTELNWLDWPLLTK